MLRECFKLEEPLVKNAIRSYLEHKGYSVKTEWLVHSDWWDDQKPDLGGVEDGPFVLEIVDEPVVTAPYNLLWKAAPNTFNVHDIESQGFHP